MKIGILTFHSQLNYGGVLQCWALKTVLERMGNEVVVIDRWLDKENSRLERSYNRWKWRQWLRFWIRSLFGLDDFNGWLRVNRTKKFIKKQLNLTSYHFVEWKDAPKELLVDCIIVGSDQVWHCGDWGNPLVYLMEDAPKVSVVAYAASFGMSSLPQFLRNDDSELAFIEAEPLYKRGLSKFKAISCREIEGIEICKYLGFDATHVVDPTLLNIQLHNISKCKRKDLVCYFLSEKIDEHFDALEQFAKLNHCNVKVFIRGNWVLTKPINVKNIRYGINMMLKRRLSPVKIMDGAGPVEFYKAFQNAKWVISDSFHALMFSICNNCNARIIRPSSKMRQQMFARIEEFANHTIGPLVVNSVSEAINSIFKGETVAYDYEWIICRKNESLEWLKRNV